MIDFMGFLIQSLWKILSIPFKIDEFTLRLWYFPIFAIILSIVWKFIFGEGGSSSDE